MKTTAEKRDRRSLSVHEGLEALETSESYAERRLQNQIAALLEGRKELNKEIERLQEKWLNAQRQDDDEGEYGVADERCSERAEIVAHSDSSSNEGRRSARVFNLGSLSRLR